MDLSFWPNGLKDGDEYKEVWAKFISRWITEYENQKIPIWGITAQNEVINQDIVLIFSV